MKNRQSSNRLFAIRCENRIQREVNAIGHVAAIFSVWKELHGGMKVFPRGFQIVTTDASSGEEVSWKVVRDDSQSGAKGVVRTAHC